MLASILGLLVVLLLVSRYPTSIRDSESDSESENESVEIEIQTLSMESRPTVHLMIQRDSMPSLEDGAPVYEGRQLYSEYNGSYKTYR
jgi:hypothetical protein